MLAKVKISEINNGEICKFCQSFVAVTLHDGSTHIIYSAHNGLYEEVLQVVKGVRLLISAMHFII